MNSKNKIYMIVLSVLLFVFLLTVGYATFTSTLTIKATATTQIDFGVVFSRSSSSATTGSVTPTLSPSTGGPTATNGTIASGTPTTISNLSASFTAPGQSVKYSFYAYNKGKATAYLNSVNFGTISCAPDTSASNPASSSYATATCNNISVTVKVNTTSYTASNTSISSHTLAKSAGEVVEVTIAYASGSQMPDGAVKVTIGDITLIYGSVD